MSGRSICKPRRRKSVQPDGDWEEFGENQFKSFLSEKALCFPDGAGMPPARVERECSRSPAMAYSSAR